MQVACNHCGAQYQFDPRAIPADGYDAQCTHCGKAFFVAPEAAEPEVSVACSRCGVVYRFPRAVIPAQGYDAECTQCHNVFFVRSPDPVSTPPLQSPPPAPVEAAEPVLLKPREPERHPPAGDDLAATASPTFFSPATSPVASEARGGLQDALALSAELGEPMPAVAGASPEEDFERILRRRRLRRRVLLAVLGSIAAYGSASYFAAPRLFDLTIGRFVGIKRTVSSAAVLHAEKGRAALLADTDAAYRQAVEHFTAALAVEPGYAEARSFSGLAHTLRGHDLQARGRAVHAVGAAALAELQTIEAAPPAQRPRDAVARSEALRAQAAKSRDESTQLYEAGGKALGAGLALLREAVAQDRDEPQVVELAAIYYAFDADSAPRAQELLRDGLAKRGLSRLDLAAPPTAWLAYLQGLLLLADRRSEEARACFAAAVQKEPRLQRARFALVEVLAQLGQRSEAQRLATEILAAVPDHDKAKTFLSEVVVASPDSAASGKAKKQKGKKRR